MPCNRKWKELGFGIGDASTFTTGGAADWYTFAVEFDLESVPTEVLENVVSATLRLHKYEDVSPLWSHSDIVVSRLLDDWDEDTYGYYNRPDSIEYVKISKPGESEGWLEIDLTSFLDDVQAGVYSNYGLEFVATENSTTFNKFATSDNANTDWHPELVIVHEAPLGTEDFVVYAPLPAVEPVPDTQVPLVRSSTATFTLKPNAETGQDAAAASYKWREDGYGLADTPTWSAGGHGDHYTFALKHDLSVVPDEVMANLTTATLRLYKYEDVSPVWGHSDMLLSRLESTWTEDSYSYYNRPTSMALKQIDQPDEAAGWFEIDVFEFVTNVRDGVYDNHGLEFTALENQATFNKFASSDNINFDWHPELVLEYNAFEGTDDFIFV